jgi:hypothetical protein
MNSLERIAAAMAFQTADRVPVIAQVFGHAATLAGVPLDAYVRDGEMLAGCQLAAWKRYGYDAVFSVMDVNVETEACGSVLRYRTNQYPVIERHALTPESHWDALAVPNPERAGRMPDSGENSTPMPWSSVVSWGPSLWLHNCWAWKRRFTWRSTILRGWNVSWILRQRLLLTMGGPNSALVRICPWFSIRLPPRR